LKVTSPDTRHSSAAIVLLTILVMKKTQLLEPVMNSVDTDGLFTNKKAKT